MARLFDDGSSEYLDINTPVITDVPMTISLWLRTNDVTINQYGVTLADKDVDDQRFGIGAGGNIANDPLFFFVRDGGNSTLISTTNFMSVNTWHHGIITGVVSGSDADYKVILDGDTGNAGDSGAGAARAVDLDRTSIGRMGDSTPSDYFSGDVAEVAVWNINLSFAEAAILAAGYSPLFVRPQNLVFYPNLIRGLNDKVGGLVLTASGTTVSAHPPIIYPANVRVGIPEAVAPPTDEVGTLINKGLIDGGLVGGRLTA